VAEAAARMRAAGADAVWVGLGAPKQDLMAARLRDLDAAPTIFCVGAAFDFVAGTVKRAPRWMQRTGLEWLHRLLSEPRRLWRRYVIGNPRFVAGVVWDRLRGRTGSGSGRSA
jgi:N-acetylglucosaminyldiphosphoundecaprenol N-acetyl-beta-D-mannosaminyltransferase